MITVICGKLENVQKLCDFVSSLSAFPALTLSKTAPAATHYVSSPILMTVSLLCRVVVLFAFPSYPLFPPHPAASAVADLQPPMPAPTAGAASSKPPVTTVSTATAVATTRAATPAAAGARSAVPGGAAAATAAAGTPPRVTALVAPAASPYGNSGGTARLVPPRGKRLGQAVGTPGSRQDELSVKLAKAGRQGGGGGGGGGEVVVGRKILNSTTTNSGLAGSVTTPRHASVGFGAVSAATGAAGNGNGKKRVFGR